MKPILFNTEMVRAILDGRKTVTRRVVKPQPTRNRGFWELGGAGWSDRIASITPIPCHSLYNRMPYKPGDILYVRETWKQATGDPAGGGYALFDTYVYKADGKAKDDYPIDCLMVEERWHPSIHMPKEAARIFLRVTEVRVERLQEINDEGAKAEGANYSVGVEEKMRRSAIDRFVEIWDSTIKKAHFDRYGWRSNPWVWVIEFERCEKPGEDSP